MDIQIVRNKKTLSTLRAAGAAAALLAFQAPGAPLAGTAKAATLLPPPTLPRVLPHCVQGTLQSYINLSANLPGAPGGCTIGSYEFTNFAFPGIPNGSTGGLTASQVQISPSLSSQGPELNFRFAGQLNAGANASQNVEVDLHYVAIALNGAAPFSGARLQIFGTQSEFVVGGNVNARFVAAQEFGCLGAFGPCGTLDSPGAVGNGIQPFSLSVLGLPPALPPLEVPAATEQFLNPEGTPVPNSLIFVLDSITLQGGVASPGVSSPSTIAGFLNLLITSPAARS